MPIVILSIVPNDCIVCSKPVQQERIDAGLSPYFCSGECSREHWITDEEAERRNTKAVW